MDWVRLIADAYEARPERAGIACRPRFHTAALAEAVAEAEDRLGLRLPASLRSLLLQTNGVTEMMAVDGGDWFDSMRGLWPVAAIVEENNSYRAANADRLLTCDFRSLAFFADAGCDGIMFGFPVADDRAFGPSVVAWWPMRDELRDIAPSLEDFLKGWLTGRISV